ncbi:B3 domain-containing transcription factor NGA3-like [Macadamia integrifolia]|uniref:B3 domain-containing transcription factor NGA3-like n=1 Tax=Macadamia integrifolia TaxID=60698 RepID=UPI001C4E7B85|nr:B3 domain-containing transcription factor NGA3-like [Macadamia integrifolia]
MEFAALEREGQQQYEEEEEEEMVADVAKNPMFSSCSTSSSSPSPSSNYSHYNKGLMPHPNISWGAQANDRQHQQRRRRQRLWLLGTLESKEEGTRCNNKAVLGEQDPSFSPRLDQMDLSSHQTQSSNSDADAGDTAAAGNGGSSSNGGNGPSGPMGSGSGGSSSCRIIEREHMFDKVVTPSDVGKLNRLVIPKQHAEKYFPLDSTTNEKGLLLSFEDRNGKPWRFRYSYWNSSQSYVMTKGWSRFVKDKRLDAGDIVSFQRGVGDLEAKEHFYIDWRRRPDAPDPSSSLLPPPLGLPLRHELSLGPPPPVPLRWSRLFLPTPNPTNPPNHMHFHPNHHHLNYDRTTHGHHHLLQFHHHNPINSPFNYSRSCYNYSGGGGGGGGGSGSADTSRSWGCYNQNCNYYNYNVVNTGGTGSGPGSGFYELRSSSTPQHDVGVGVGVVQEGTGGDGDAPMVIESVPVVHGKAAAKRVRLFGVNLDCPTPEDDDSDSEGDILSSTSSYNTIPCTTGMPSSHLSLYHLPSASSLPSLQLRVYSGAPLPTAPDQLPPNQSLSFNFDI